MESLFVTIGFAMLGGILFWSIAGRYWGKAKAKPYQLGLWWGAWLVAASVMVSGGKYYRLGFEEVFFRMILIAPIFFGIGFIAGFGFRKLKAIPMPFSAIAPNGGYSLDAWYEKALDEIDSGKQVRAIWARALADSGGDDGKARSIYIKSRVSELRAAASQERMELPATFNSSVETTIKRGVIVSEVTMIWDHFNVVGRVCAILILIMLAYLVWK